MDSKKSNSLPQPTKLLRRKEVSSRTGMARSTIYDHMKRGDFPSPIKIGERTVGWVESEIETWLCQQISKSRGDGK